MSEEMYEVECTNCPRTIYTDNKELVSACPGCGTNDVPDTWSETDLTDFKRLGPCKNCNGVIGFLPEDVSWRDVEELIHYCKICGEHDPVDQEINRTGHDAMRDTEHGRERQNMR